MATGSQRVDIASSGEPIPVEVEEVNAPSQPAFREKLARQFSDNSTHMVAGIQQLAPDAVVLDPSDAIDTILIEMVKLNRRKRADYGLDGDPTSNFFRTAEMMRAKGYKDWTALTSVEYAMAIKAARVEALRANGRLDETQNESVRDTLLDTAVYEREHPQASEAI